MAAEITKHGAATTGSIPNFVWILLAILAVFTYFFGLNLPLLGPDEPCYAQVAREMFERGDWITPTLGGFNWFEKPALLYWLEIAAYHIFGVNEFAARLGPALFGLGTVASLWLLGKSFTTENTEDAEKTLRRNSHSSDLNNSIPSVANHFPHYLAVIAASTVGILAFSHGASFDIILTFPITASLVSYFLFDQTRVKSFTACYLPLIGFYFFIGVALLAKGLVGIVFPFAIVALYHLLSRKMPSRTLILSVFWGTILALAVAAIWYVPIYQRQGYQFIDEFFVQHHFQRFTSNKYQHPQPFYFFLWILPLLTIPWLPFFLTGTLMAVKSIFPRRGTEIIETSVTLSPHHLVPTTPLLLFALAWLAVPLFFFSFSGSKLPGYILPAVPAGVILAAMAVTRFVNGNWQRASAILSISVATFIVAIGLVMFVMPGFADGDSVKGLMTAANDRGYASSKVLCMHTVSHNAEFYAAGRLIRASDGRLKRFVSPAEVTNVIEENGGQPVIVLIPIQFLPQLATEPRLKADFIRDNGELAVLAVSALPLSSPPQPVH